jgi:Protein of unknown function (DUF1275)
MSNSATGAPAVHDTVAGRAAANASPVHLAVRDWLLVALSFSSGSYEAICFLSFGKVFSAFQTGNILFLGIAAAGTRPPAGPNPVSVITSLAAFAAGAAAAMPILKASGAEVGYPKKMASRSGRAAYRSRSGSPWPWRRALSPYG